jgi:hypothetical protein
MLPLASAGYHVIAPDQRGYGRTTGWDSNYDGDLTSFSMLIRQGRIGAGFRLVLPVRGGSHRARCQPAGRVLVRARKARWVSRWR